MAKLIIFDLDGTLIDSIPDILYNINIMLKHFGYKERTYGDIRSFIGNGARNLVKRSIGEEISEDRLDECLAFYNKIYTESNSPKTNLFDGVKEVLLAFKERGYKLAVLTNKPQITTDTVIKRYFSFIKFDRVVGFKDGKKCKPDNTETLKIINELGVNNEDVFFVGDGETDVETAKNSLVKCVAVLWGYRDKDLLKDYGAKIFAQTPKDLLQIIK